MHWDIWTCQGRKKQSQPILTENFQNLILYGLVKLSWKSQFLFLNEKCPSNNMRRCKVCGRSRRGNHRMGRGWRMCWRRSRWRWRSEGWRRPNGLHQEVPVLVSHHKSQSLSHTKRNTFILYKVIMLSWHHYFEGKEREEWGQLSRGQCVGVWAWTGTSYRRLVEESLCWLALGGFTFNILRYFIPNKEYLYWNNDRGYFRDDKEEDADWLARKLTSLRIWPDEQVNSGRMRAQMSDCIWPSLCVWMTFFDVWVEVLQT